MQLPERFDASITHDCLRSAENWTSTTYYNVCNGQITEVPRGTMWWVWPLLFLCIMVFTALASYRMLAGLPMFDKREK